jgi:hypothetical protein
MRMWEILSRNFQLLICCEPGSRCRPNEGIFGSEKPRGVGILEQGVYEQGREMGRSVYKQPGNEVDGSYHSKEDSK